MHPSPSRHSRGRTARAVFTRRAAAALSTAVLALAGPPRAAAQTVNPASYAGMRWRSIGPYRSGYVYAVSGIPNNPAVYYIGLPEGGVWKTTDGGTVWKPIFDAEHVPSIGAVSVAPSHPDIVYVGTGDPTGWSFTPGNGVYKSTDAGATWTNIGLKSTRYITSLIVDPRNADIVLVGALGSAQRGGGDANSARGVYRTTDGGRTWTHVLYVDAHTGVSNMSYDYSDPRIIFAVFQRSGVRRAAGARDALAPLGTGIYKSTDEGATWHELSGQGLPKDTRGFELAVASGTHGRRVYVEALGTGRDAGGVYRSDDGGRTWSLGTTQILSAGGHIYVDPKNPDLVYLMGTAVYRSVDGGRHFVAYKGSPGGDDPRDLWIDPANPQRMLMGVDQGPAITMDGGATWTPWYNLPNGQFYRVSTDNHFPYRVCAPQQDSGTACVLSRSDFGEIRTKDWASVGGFENGFIVTDPLNDRWVYTQGWYHVLRRYDRNTGQVAVMYIPTPEDHFGGAPPLAFSPQDPHTLYMGAQYVLASSDSARTWRHISPDLTTRTDVASADGAAAPAGRGRAAAIQTLAPSTVAAGEIWVGTSNGLIQLTRDGGAHWTNVTPPTMPARAAVNIIDPSHHDAGTAYAAVDVGGDDHPHIYRTTDFGAHWDEIVTGLPTDALVRVVREDAADPDLLYAGTVTSAWVSFDKGDHWQSLQLNLPTTVISDMDVHGNDLVISTYGRALWILDDVTPLRQMRSAMASSSKAFLFEPAPAYRMRWDNIEDTPLPPEVPAGQNPPEGAIIDYDLKTPASGPITLSVYDADNHLVRQYSSVAAPPDSFAPNIPAYWLQAPIVLDTTPGMHRIAWDLRYPPPAALRYGYYGNLLDYTEYTLNVHAIKGETPRVQPTGPLVAPGTYRVALTVDGQTYTQSLKVVNDPRIPMTQAQLVAQTQFQLRMTAGMAVSYQEFNRIQALRSTLSTDEAHAQGKPHAADIIAAAKAVDAKADSLANGPQGGFGPANRELARHLEDMESGDVDPTESDLAAAHLNCQDIDAALAGWRELQTTDVPTLNALLTAAHLAPLPTVEVSTAPACTVGGNGDGQ
ncbi:MAG TPA: hypothetical protein VFJ96_04680 [Gemmatimonadaceae bacterium]|nr:hypothetical protein [Gemmatimonadaceae bacterium]